MFEVGDRVVFYDNKDLICSCNHKLVGKTAIVTFVTGKYLYVKFIDTEYSYGNCAWYAWRFRKPLEQMLFPFMYEYL